MTRLEYFLAGILFVLSQRVSGQIYECGQNTTNPITLSNATILSYSTNSTNLTTCRWQLIFPNATAITLNVLNDTAFSPTTPQGSLTLTDPSNKTLYSWPGNAPVSTITFSSNLTGAAIVFPINDSTRTSRIRIGFVVLPVSANNNTNSSTGYTNNQGVRVGFGEVAAGQSKTYLFNTNYVQVAAVVTASNLLPADNSFYFTIQKTQETGSLSSVNANSDIYQGGTVIVTNNNSASAPISSNAFYFVGVPTADKRPILSRPGTLTVNGSLTIVASSQRVGVVFANMSGTVVLKAGDLSVAGNSNASLTTLDTTGIYRKSWLMGDVFNIDASQGQVTVTTSDDSPPSDGFFNVTLGSRGFIMSPGYPLTSPSPGANSTWVLSSASSKNSTISITYQAILSGNSSLVFSSVGYFKSQTSSTSDSAKTKGPSLTVVYTPSPAVNSNRDGFFLAYSGVAETRLSPMAFLLLAFFLIL